ncbi:MAG: protein kinase [bacterium]|nr:protein kinase [bacterium]
MSWSPYIKAKIIATSRNKKNINFHNSTVFFDNLEPLILTKNNNIVNNQKALEVLLKNSTFSNLKIKLDNVNFDIQNIKKIICGKVLKITGPDNNFALKIVKVALKNNRSNPVGSKIKQLYCEVVLNRYFNNLNTVNGLSNSGMEYKIEANNSMYLAIKMPFIKGLTLNNLMKKLLTISNKRKTLTKLASALHKIHEMGIIHRDIKASNIMVEIDKINYTKETCEIKTVTLIDFGFSSLSEKALNQKPFNNSKFIDPEYNKKSLKKCKGTFNFMPPETALKADIKHRQFHNLSSLYGQKMIENVNRNVEFKSDIFSLGIVFLLVIAKRYFIEGTPLGIGNNNDNIKWQEHHPCTVSDRVKNCIKEKNTESDLLKNYYLLTIQMVKKNLEDRPSTNTVSNYLESDVSDRFCNLQLEWQHTSDQFDYLYTQEVEKVKLVKPKQKTSK